MILNIKKKIIIDKPPVINVFKRFDNEGTKTDGETATLKICCPKLEKGSKATPYIPYVDNYNFFYY